LRRWAGAYFSPAITETVLDYFLEYHDGNKRTNMLTTREREVDQLIAEGKLDEQVAYMPGINVKTVDSHRSAVIEKLKFHTTAWLVLYAVGNNIVQP
jgi:DNA-binding NarL/FixJ family response regulator